MTIRTRKIQSLRIVATAATWSATSIAAAGMPAPLPSDFETVTRLTESAHGRVQAISFFVFGVLLSALLVKLLWNALCRDFPGLPRLRYFSALGGTLLWGLLFVIVLTMVAGARELMTPGAWEKQGMTYTLAGSQEEPAVVAAADSREAHLEKLSVELLRFAAKNDGRYPDSFDELEHPGDLGDVPGYSGLRYLLVPGRNADETGRLLVYEPEVEHGRRLVLMTDGEVRSMTTAELSQMLERAVRE